MRAARLVALTSLLLSMACSSSSTKTPPPCDGPTSSDSAAASDAGIDAGLPGDAPAVQSDACATDGPAADAAQQADSHGSEAAPIDAPADVLGQLDGSQQHDTGELADAQGQHDTHAQADASTCGTCGEGQYCLESKGICYTPGLCSDWDRDGGSLECLSAGGCQVFDDMSWPWGARCHSCQAPSAPCRPHEVCCGSPWGNCLAGEDFSACN